MNHLPILTQPSIEPLSMVVVLKDTMDSQKDKGRSIAAGKRISHTSDLHKEKRALEVKVSENLIMTEKINGKRQRGRIQQKCLDGLVAWFGRKTAVDVI